MKRTVEKERKTELQTVRILNFLVFYSIVERADRIARKLDASAKRNT